MTATQKYEAFITVRATVRAIENRHIQEKARAAVAARFAILEEQRDQARKDGRFSLLK